MSTGKYILGVLSILIIFSSCEEVIDLDLNYTNPAFVAEASIYKDSVSHVRLTRTSSYFEADEPEFIEDAIINISDGSISEELSYTGDGYYTGTTIIGTEETTYEIEIMHDGISYEGISSMPQMAEFISVSFGKSNTQSALNPFGETVFSIRCEFEDNPEVDNYYMIHYTEDGEMIEKNYFMLTESSSIGGVFSNINDTIRFSESIFYEGGEVDIHIFSIDESIYNYFMQLNDILFWKRRVMPPTPYNPASNISNGALGYFAAFAFDSETIILE